MTPYPLTAATWHATHFPPRPANGNATRPENEIASAMLAARADKLSGMALDALELEIANFARAARALLIARGFSRDTLDGFNVFIAAAVAEAVERELTQLLCTEGKDNG